MRFQDLIQSDNHNLNLRATLLTETHINQWLSTHIAVPPHVNTSPHNRKPIGYLDLSDCPRKNFLDYLAVFTISIDGAQDSAFTKLVEVFGPATSSSETTETTLLDWQPSARDWPFVAVHLIAGALDDYKKGMVDLEEQSVRECLAYHFPNSSLDELFAWHENDLIPLNEDDDFTPGLADILYRQSQQTSNAVTVLPQEMNW